MPKTLIVAASGRVSRRVAAALCDRGEPPRAPVRDEAKARDVLVDNRGAPLPLEIVVSDFVELLHGLDEINRFNLYATPTDTVQQLTGRPPRTIDEYIERNRAAFS